MASLRPFMTGPWRLAVGLHALDPALWLERGPDVRAQIERRRQLLEERPGEVSDSLPEALPAAREAAAMVLAHLAAHDPDALAGPAGAVADRSQPRFDAAASAERPLEGAGRLVAEDLCLLEAGAGGYRLTAGMVCFPSHWSLRQKLGHPLSVIHEPVPGFAERLGRAVDRFFRGIAVERPVWRANWSLVDTDELFLPPAHRGTASGFDPERPGETLWLRVERQTLRRLPATRAVLFTIRTHVEPLHEAVAAPGAAAALAARLRELPEPMARYKGLRSIRGPVLAYLERVSIDGGGSAPPGLPRIG
jgi:hypothetical protein